MNSSKSGQPTERINSWSMLEIIEKYKPNNLLQFVKDIIFVIFFAGFQPLGLKVVQ